MSISNLQKDWLTTTLGLSREKLSVQLIAGDASPRRYYRVTSKVNERDDQSASKIFMISPSTESNQEFLSIRALLEEYSIRVPRLFSADICEGLFLLEDLGDEVLLGLLTNKSADRLYDQALDMLHRMQISVPASAKLPLYEKARLQNELDLFPRWFIAKLLGMKESREANKIFSGLSERLIASATEQPQVFVHRDFHSRNLMCLSNGDLATIDFQDAVWGPITYDVVSLLKDCYIEWPRERQLAWLTRYCQQLSQPVCMDDVPTPRIVRWFDLMGLQRHIKVLGIFARLAIRDSKPAYLADLPRVIRYIREVLLIYVSEPDIKLFRDWFEDLIMPEVTDQAWFSDAESHSL